VQLTEFDPLEKIGHNLFQDGSLPWLGELDGFLRQHQLPTWSSSEAIELPDRLGLGSSHLRFYVEYMTAPVSKAMAFSSSAHHSYYRSDDRISLAAARELALSDCANAHNADCTIVMENDRWVGPND